MRPDDASQPMFPSGSFDEALLDMHLGHLGPAESRRLMEQIQTDPKLASQHEALTSVFQALRSVHDEQPAADLADRVLGRVQAAGSPFVMHTASRASSGDSGEVWENPRVIRLHSLREVLAVAAMIVLAVGVGVPGLLHMRERSQRTACAWNLGQIGRGMQAYANAFKDSLPFAGWSSASSWRPTAEPGVAVVPNRRHIYPLVRAEFVPAAAFVCPSSESVAMPSDQVRNHDDFLESRNVSYASQNMAGVRPSVRLDSSVVVAADDNPLFADGLPMIDFAAQRLGLSDPAQSNSRAHGGVGQNVLRLHGGSEWVISPNCGVDQDNIWTLEGVKRYTGREGPASANDTHLLK